MEADSAPSEIRDRIGRQIRQLLRAAPAVHAELARRVGVGVTDLLALDHVTSAPAPLGVVELSELLKVRSASATVLVDRLVASGHVQRHPHDTDRRRIGLHATPAARLEVRAALCPLLDDISQIVGELDAREASVVLRFLTDLTTALEHFTQAPAGPDAR